MLISQVRPAGALLLSIATLSACSVNPTVRYVEATAPGEAARQPKLIDSFYRQRNELTFELKAATAGDKPTEEAFVVTNRRLEDTTRRIMILDADPFWSRTTINLTKVQDTDLIASASSEVVDRRAEIMTNVGNVLKVVIPLIGAAAGPSPGQKCSNLKVQPCAWTLPSDANGAQGKETAATGLTVVWGAVPATAVPVQDSSYQDFLKKPQKGMFYSACREVAITYAAKDAINNTIYSWRGRIADPNFVDFVAFPGSGQIEFHNQCGVSVKSVKDPTVTTDVLVTTAVTQAVAIKEAIDKAEEARDAAAKKAAGKP